MKLASEFNEKYKNYIEKGFEDRGMEIDIPEVVEYLDEVFQDLTKIPLFNFSMCKLKFGTCRFYSSLGDTLTSLIESKINEIIKSKL